MKIFLLLFIVGTTCLEAGAQYKGRVFVDANKNDVYDRGEKTLKNVSVSDGLNVVQTADDGTYSLSGHPREKFLFITTPSGYKTNNAHYHRIEPNKSDYDFGVTSYGGGIQKDGSHRFVQISDTEIGEVNGHDAWVADVRGYAANEDAAFIVHTGDICYEPGLSSHIRLMNTANMNTPVFYCIGNHDLVKGKYGEEVFENNYGPVFYSFEAGNVHYIVTPMLGGDYRPGYTKEDVYRWLKNDLKNVPKTKAVMVFNHDLIDSKDSFRYGISDNEYVDLKEHNLKAWIYGHWHINHILDYKNGVRSVCTSTLIRGGIDHALSAFRVMHIDAGGDFRSELRYSYIDKLIQITSLENGQAAVLPSGAVPLSVNTYSTTSPIRSVSYSCESEGRVLFRNKPLGQQTDFNWYAEIELPGQFENQPITVCVEACFANGEVAKAERTFVYHRQPEHAVVQGEEWTNLLGSPAHVGVAKDSLSTPLRLAWVRNIGSNIYMTSPLVYKNAVYVASTDDNDRGKSVVACIDSRNGAVRWKYAVRGSVKNSIAITSGLVFAQDVYGNLYALDADKGTLMWEKKLNLNLLPALNEGLIASDGVVYAGTGQGLCALKAATGEEIWCNRAWNRREGCTATLSLNNNVLVGHAHWSALYANDATTGKLLWGKSDSGLRHRSASAGMINELLYLISDVSFFVIEAKTGQIVVRKDLGYNVNVTSVPLVTKNEIIFGTADRGIVALDRETLNEKWNFMTKPALIYSAPYVRDPSSTVETSPVLAGDAVFAGASDGTIYALNPSTGKQLWKHSTGAPVFGSVAISGNTLYAVDFSGNVYGFVSAK